MLLINPTDVIALAFMPREQISAEVIRSIKIDVAQEGYIRPRFGEVMFQEMCKGQHQDFVVGYIRPALAQYVRSMVIEELAIQISDQGVIAYSAAQTTQSSKSDSTDTTRTQQTLTTNLSQGTSNSTVAKTEEQNTTDTLTKRERGEYYSFEVTEEESVLTESEESGSSTEKSDTATTGATTQQGNSDAQVSANQAVVGSGVQDTTTSSFRAATAVERRVLCLRAMADAKVLLAKAVRYVEANVGQFDSYQPREFGSRIFF